MEKWDGVEITKPDAGMSSRGRGPATSVRPDTRGRELSLPQTDSRPPRAGHTSRSQTPVTVHSGHRRHCLGIRHPSPPSRHQSDQTDVAVNFSRGADTAGQAGTRGLPQTDAAIPQGEDVALGECGPEAAFGTRGILGPFFLATFPAMTKRREIGVTIERPL